MRRNRFTKEQVTSQEQTVDSMMHKIMELCRQHDIEARTRLLRKAQFKHEQQLLVDRMAALMQNQALKSLLRKRG